MTQNQCHTPGPWVFKRLTGTDETNAEAIKYGLKTMQHCSEAGERYVGSEHGPIALVRTRTERKEHGKNATPYDAPDAERDANACLIATAPELLSALEALVKAEEEYGEKGNVAINEMLLTAYAAIKKVRGK